MGDGRVQMEVISSGEKNEIYIKEKIIVVSKVLEDNAYYDSIILI